MQETRKMSVVLTPDGNRNKPPISASPQRQLKKRDSVSSDVSSSRPNSTTTSDGNNSTGDEEENISSDTSETSDVGDSTDDEEKGLDPISEEASMRKRSDGENDDSTCCDEDFTWVRSENTVIEKHPLQSSPSSKNASKPPRPGGASLDRRRQTQSSRHDRDHKSRSTHLVREKCMSGDLKESHHARENRKEAGYHSESYINHYRRGSPGFWEFPPPPAFPYPGFDLHHLYGYHSSRDDLRMFDYHRRHDFFRYGSNGALPISSSQELYHGGGGCCNRYPQPPSTCCSCDHKMNFCSGNQRQDIDERLRRLQSDKDALALQVQVLTEQVSSQNDKIIDLERSLTDKTQLLNNTEDMLQREMLTRSSLETQKLELMSAMSELKLQQAALERENLELRSSQMNNNNSLPSRRPQASRGMLTSTPNSTFHGSVGSLQQSNAGVSAPKTPPASLRHQINPHFSSLPRTSFTSGSLSTSNGPTSKSMIGTSNALIDNNANPKQRNVAFGKNLIEMRSMNSLPSMQVAAGSKNFNDQILAEFSQNLLKGFEKQRGYSVPNLAETERVIEDSNDPPRSFTPQPTASPSLGQKSKGFRSIFGKIKRSNSGNLEDLPGEGEFKRGGVRATAGARLGWSHTNKSSDKPFEKWDVDELCSWFDEMGLGSYEDEVRKCFKDGATALIEISPIDMERDLNLKTPLHRKKITLAIADMTGKEKDEIMLNAGKLDTAWIMRWLDDIGLPQHKDMFSTARMDGRMLNKLTMDDLASLHVTSCLHVASLRRGIQVMRENNWNPDCLIRRSSGDESISEPIHLWTAHRVMEWLRCVDLAEYAPNLRGAGVHGALMMYEPKFTAELLADLLSISQSKTLLRRHLATHFKELLGRDVIQGKRDAENVLGYQPLTITAKIKTPKKSQFSLKRKKSSKSGDEWSDFVCPMGSSGDQLLTTNSTSNQNATTTTGISMTNPTVQEIAANSEVASLPTSASSPTSTRSSTSTS
ncbi:liprin-beta-1 isoform X4 [Hermetia illucens]|uniref:liprin-beta-1 isoform X4 n=1 Tax=Hermetia illucens TaxID=343691 RepID=UPI0018CC45A7|nr:liprin-beta-1 isoform X4 [Hermetia illucens]